MEAKMNTPASLLLCIVTVLFQKTYGSGNAILEVASVSGSPPEEKIQFCIQYNSAYQTLPTSVEHAAPYNLKDFTDIEGCDLSDYKGHQIVSDRTVAAVMRGNCSFTSKAVLAQSQKAAALLIVDYKNSSFTPVPGGNKTEFGAFNISLAVIAWKDYHQVLSSQGRIRVSLYAPPQPQWDGNMIFIIFASTLIVLVGGAWAAYGDEQALRQRKPGTAKSGNGVKDEEGDDESNPFSVCGVLIWFTFICATILLLYFFYDYMVYVFIALFCIVGAHSLYRCLLPAWTYIMPINYDIPLNRLPCIKSKAKLGSLLLLMPCVTLAIFWAVERHSSYAWILQDVLGVSFCIFLIQNLRLPSLKIIGILLVLLLVYDVFFVFITPLLTSNGESVMVSVATGGSKHSKEALPMVFLIPLFGDSPQYMCRERPYSLLGFGDVIIPGLLVAYNAGCDVRLRGRHRPFYCLPYCMVAVSGYMVGMSLCMVSLILMKTGQPALLYLVPCTLIPTVVMAAWQRQLSLLFHGHAHEVLGLDSVEAQVGAARGSRRHVQGENVEADAEGNNDDVDDDDEVCTLGTDEHNDEHINLIR